MDYFCWAVDNNDFTLVRKLIGDCDLDALDSNECLPVNIGVGRGHLDMVKLLVEAGCSLNKADGRGKYPLHAAALTSTESTADVVRYLLEQGADPDQRDRYEETALMTACYWSNPDVVSLLAERTTDINYQTAATHRTAIHYAAMGIQNAQIVPLLLDRGADPRSTHDDSDTALIIATRSNCVDAVEALLNVDCSVNYQGYYGSTALHWAANYDHVDIVKLLLEYSAMPNLPNSLNRTPLHNTALFGAVGSARLLVDAGADTEVVDSEGFTPLLAAVHSGSGDIVKYLLYANAEIDNVSHRQPSPLLTALKKPDTIMARCLILAGCDLGQFWKQLKNFKSNAQTDSLGTMMQDSEDFSDLMNIHICNVKRLQHLCCLRIRRNLSRGIQVIADIQCLSLPSAMNDYLSLKELLP